MSRCQMCGSAITPIMVKCPECGARGEKMRTKAIVQQKLDSRDPKTGELYFTGHRIGPTIAICLISLVLWIDYATEPLLILRYADDSNARLGAIVWLAIVSAIFALIQWLAFRKW